jgi:hypothetical protein
MQGETEEMQTVAAVVQPSWEDVLLSRGKKYDLHPGNVKFTGESRCGAFFTVCPLLKLPNFSFSHMKSL